MYKHRSAPKLSLKWKLMSKSNLQKYNGDNCSFLSRMFYQLIFFKQFLSFFLKQNKFYGKKKSITIILVILVDKIILVIQYVITIFPMGIRTSVECMTNCLKVQ